MMAVFLEQPMGVQIVSRDQALQMKFVVRNHTNNPWQEGCYLAVLNKEQLKAESAPFEIVDQAVLGEGLDGMSKFELLVPVIMKMEALSGVVHDVTLRFFTK